MELPQPRPFGTEGRKPTHDFLSLYSPVQQDPRPSQGGYLKTHDFLQLERVGKNNAKEENTVEKTTLEKPPPPAPPPPSVERLLPGGIGTYSISHVPYFNQRVPKPEGSSIFTVAEASRSSTDRNEENSNCSSYTGSDFTLWEESVVKKGKTRKENITGDIHVVRDAGMKIGGQWTTSERPAQSSSNHHRNSTTFSSLSSSQPSSVQKNQSLIDIIKSAKGTYEEEDDDDDDEEFVLKKEHSSHYTGNLTIKVDGKSTDQKANTPRSKHSATEQRRRSKINDRFQMLRELIPHSDQKRDKASFLLEVVEYIQFLQEKVHKYEGSYQGWNHDPAKLMAWRNNHRPAEGFLDQSRGLSSGSGPALMFAAKLEENNIGVSPTIPGNVQNHVESDTSTATTFKAMDHHPGLTNKGVPLPVPLQPNIFTPGGSNGAVAPLAPRLASDAENTLSQPQSQLWQSSSCTTDSVVASDKMKEQELTIESGTISISSVYSQGLLTTLTQALHSSGIDLSQATISVKIDLGKRANSRLSAPTSVIKDDEVPSNNQAMARSRIARSGEESDQALKRLKTGKS
uniref:Putative transcription factor BIM1 isoform X1 n=2 Tax=Davidia involucrata TaxID=16924 RepID=A0A5B6Z129_DAVIN